MIKRKFQIIVHKKSTKNFEKHKYPYGALLFRYLKHRGPETLNGFLNMGKLIIRLTVCV